MSQNVSNLVKPSQNVSKYLRIQKHILDDTVGIAQNFSKCSEPCVTLRSKTDHCGGFPGNELRGGENKSLCVNCEFLNAVCYCHFWNDVFIVNCQLLL